MADRVAQTTGEAIRAARAHDSEAFGAATDLLALHPESREVHALMMRELLETVFPDGLTGDDGPMTPEHLGQLHAYETVLVYVLAFGPFLLLAVTVWIARRRMSDEETPEHRH